MLLTVSFSHFSSINGKHSLVPVLKSCFPLLFMKVNAKFLGFGLLVGQKKQSEDVTLCVMSIFNYFF